MLIGKDFDKIEFEFLGLDLLEPNAFIGDSILGILSLLMAMKLWKIRNRNSFYMNWFLFFTSFGIGFIMGGLGHLFWNYWGVEGKYFSWYAGLFSTLFIEQAMIAASVNRQERNIFKSIVRLKFVYATLILSFILITQDVSSNVAIGFVVPSTNSAVGMIFALGFLPLYYRKSLKTKFTYFFLSLFLLLPISFVQHFKVNLHQWLDRNDISHILLFFALIMYFFGILSQKRKEISQIQLKLG